jgi:hypothetical protein
MPYAPEAMRPLDFEFARPRRAVRRAGWALLALAALFSADLGRSYLAARDDVAGLEAGLARGREAAARSPAPPAHAGSAEEIAAARMVIARFATPWPALFDALEAVQLDDVSLLAIEPDAATGSVLISGEARTYLALLTYVARLRDQPGLARVYVARHEVRDTEPRRPLAFSVAARWRRM